MVLLLTLFSLTCGGDTLLAPQHRLLPEERRRKFKQANSGGDMTIQTGNSEVKFSLDCDLGGGYDTWARACHNASPFDTPPACSDTVDPAETCTIDGMLKSKYKFYKRKNSETSDSKVLLDTAISAEGGGWGTTMSASVKYMQQKETTSQRVSFSLGKSGDVYEERLNNIKGLRLTPSAKRLLQSNWRSFLAMYGTTFVKQITYSTNFIGSVDLYVHQHKNSRELAIGLEMSSDIVFSPSGSTSLKNAVDNSKGKLKANVDLEYTGTMIPFDRTQLDDDIMLLKSVYEQWSHNVLNAPTENAEASRMIYDRLLKLDDVQEAILEAYCESGQTPEECSKNLDDIQTAFDFELPTGEVIKIFTKDYFWSKAMQRSLSIYIDDECVQENDALEELVEQYMKTVTTHLHDLEDMTKMEMADRKLEIEAGNYDWFIGWSREMTNEIEDRLHTVCPLYTRSPTPAPTFLPTLRTGVTYTICAAAQSYHNAPCVHTEMGTAWGNWIKLYGNQYYNSGLKGARWQLHETGTNGVYNICLDSGSGCLYSTDGWTGDWIILNKNPSDVRNDRFGRWRIERAETRDRSVFTICHDGPDIRCMNGKDGPYENKYMHLSDSHNVNKNRDSGRFTFQAEPTHLGLSWPKVKGY